MTISDRLAHFSKPQRFDWTPFAKITGNSTRVLTDHYGKPPSARLLVEMQGFNPKQIQIVGLKKENDRVSYEGYNWPGPDVTLLVFIEDGNVHHIDYQTVAGVIADTSLSGTLLAFFETGTEGVLWSLQDDVNVGYDGLHVLEPGDHLKVFAKDGSIAWEGNIELEYEREYKPYPKNPKYGQQVEPIYGMYVHGFQVGVEPAIWSQMFHDQLKAEWRKKV